MSNTQKTVEGIRGIAVYTGLGHPAARAFVAGALVGTVAYAAGVPTSCFDEEGQLRPFRGLSSSPHARYAHFLLVPVAAATVAGLFT